MIDQSLVQSGFDVETQAFDGRPSIARSKDNLLNRPRYTPPPAGPVFP